MFKKKIFSENITDGFMPFPRALVWSQVQTACLGFELGVLIPFPSKITIILSKPGWHVVSFLKYDKVGGEKKKKNLRTLG